jgi:hypothetical protein
MTDISILFSKTLSLEALQTEIAAFENLQGPLKALDRTADKSVGTFKFGRRPKPTVELRLQGPIPNGYVEVCRGPVFVVGQPQAVMALRKT